MRWKESDDESLLLNFCRNVHDGDVMRLSSNLGKGGHGATAVVWLSSYDRRDALPSAKYCGGDQESPFADGRRRRRGLLMCCHRYNTGSSLCRLARPSH